MKGWIFPHLMMESEEKKGAPSGLARNGCGIKGVVIRWMGGGKWDPWSPRSPNNSAQPLNRGAGTEIYERGATKMAEIQVWTLKRGTRGKLFIGGGKMRSP